MTPLLLGLFLSEKLNYKGKKGVIVLKTAENLVKKKYKKIKPS